jgi:thiamine pyrophosphate-dependent acetolactate synthase large subunit-like protein
LSKISGAQALMKSFEEEGVEVIFGFPGGKYMMLYSIQI